MLREYSNGLMLARSRMRYASVLATLILSANLLCRTAPSPERFGLPFHEYWLTNGLHVILSEDHSSPIIAISVTYDVGSRNEMVGKSGLAHLMEHMMFQGSENVGKGEHLALIEEFGGTANGTTNKERTNYFETVPATQLNLPLFLEADRMRSLELTQANLDMQRAVVLEEKRQNYDNRPYGAASDFTSKVSYSSWSYQHPTIGSESDIQGITLDEVRSFFGTYYSPNNATLTVVGDFDERQASRVIERYFSSLPRRPSPPAAAVNEIPRTQETRGIIEDRLANLPRYTVNFKTVPGNHPDACSLQILEVILNTPKTGRLSKVIVEPKLGINFSASFSESREVGLFSISVTTGKVKDIHAVAAAIDSELASIAAFGIAPEELARAKKQIEHDQLVGQLGRPEPRSMLERANTFGRDAVFYRDTARSERRFQQLLALTPEQVKQVAAKYFSKANRVIVVIKPVALENGPS